MEVTLLGTGSADGNGALDEASTRAWWEFMDRNQLSRCNWLPANTPWIFDMSD